MTTLVFLLNSFNTFITSGCGYITGVFGERKHWRGEGVWGRYQTFCTINS